MHLDLHNHTQYSPDSRVLPAHLVARAKEMGLDGIAISDHNAVGGVPAAEMAAGYLVFPRVHEKTFPKKPHLEFDRHAP